MFAIFIKKITKREKYQVLSMEYFRYDDNMEIKRQPRKLISSKMPPLRIKRLKPLIMNHILASSSMIIFIPVASKKPQQVLNM